MQAKLISPDTYTYHCTYMGKEINPVLLNKKWNTYLDQTYKNLLEQACISTKSVAVRSTLLTRHDKELHKERRYHSGIKVYYLFPAENVPLSVYLKLNQDQEDGKIVYE